MTTKLYWNDPYLVSATVVVDVVESDGIVLRETPFYAHGGGQPGDVGVIGSDDVVDTRADADGRILHLTAQTPSCAPGDRLTARIDWERRYALMRHHSLLHVVHLAVQHLAGPVDPLGSSVGMDRARIEYATKDSFDIERVGSLVNELIRTADAPAVRFDGQGTRVWELPGWPPIPCGGTHVRRLSEIVDATLTAKSAGKRGTRIYAVAGTIDLVGALSF